MTLVSEGVFIVNDRSIYGSTNPENQTSGFYFKLLKYHRLQGSFHISHILTKEISDCQFGEKNMV